MFMSIRAVIFALVMSLGSQCFAGEAMSKFLKTCAYGTLVGAGVGLVTLAWTENPNDKLNNVARGASLGLYAGIAVGYAMVTKKDNLDYADNRPSAFWMQLKTSPKSSLEGAEVHWLAAEF